MSFAVPARFLNRSIPGADRESAIRRVQLQVTCSAGATVFDPSEGFTSGEASIAVADRALYEAKEAGRDRLVFDGCAQEAQEGKDSGRL